MVLKATRRDILFDDLEEMPGHVRQLYRDRKLHEVIGRAYKNVPSVREMIDKARLKPSRIHNSKSLAKLPISRKTYLPGFIAVPDNTAKIRGFARALWAAGFRKGDIVFNGFSGQFFPIAASVTEVLQQISAIVILTCNTDISIDLQTMRDRKVNGFVGTPSYLMSLIQKAEETGLNFRADFNLVRAWFTSEKLTPEIRNTLENNYGIDTRQTYTVSELSAAIAYECSQKAGLHVVDDYMLEIVDPVTNNQLKPGEVGEVVLTAILDETVGLLRYGTGDLSAVITEHCPCGRTAYRLTEILGKSINAIEIHGEVLISSLADEVILECGAISHYQLVVTRNDDRDELNLKAELKDETIDRQKLSDELTDKFHNACHIRIDRIDFLIHGTLPEQYQRILDERQ